MKVCVFGASGYVGASVYKRLKETNEMQVSGTFLDEPPLFDDLFKLDINEPESFSDYYKQEKPDVVVWSVMDGPHEHELTDNGLINLLTFLTPSTKLIYISSDFVFGAGKGPYNETDPLSTLPNDHVYSTYTNAKVKAERLIHRELSNYVILRAGPIYGENEIGKLDEHTDQLSYHVKLGRPIAFRDDLIRTFVHVKDLVDVIMEMVGNDEKGIFHTGSTEAISYFEFMKTVAEQLGFNQGIVEKASEYEEADHEIPKNTALHTDKITKIMKEITR
jgi:dTDP-4-dehydrorhamnose reductase